MERLEEIREVLRRILSVPSRRGDKKFVTVTVEGREASASVDTGNAGMLLDASCFPPETFRDAVTAGLC